MAPTPSLTLRPLEPGDVARLRAGGEDHRVVDATATHVVFACEPNVERPRGTVRRTLGNGARVTCSRCIAAKAADREVFMTTMTTAANDPHHGTALQLCPGCKRTLGHAEVTERDGALFHASCAPAASDARVRMIALRLIADAVQVLPHDLPEVHLGVTREGYDALCGVDGAKLGTYVYGERTPPYAIDYVDVRFGGVRFRATCPRRPLTDEERAGLGRGPERVGDIEPVKTLAELQSDLAVSEARGKELSRELDATIDRCSALVDAMPGANGAAQ